MYNPDQLTGYAYCIFTIDTQDNPRARAMFESYMRMFAKHKVVPCIGSYKGEQAYYYICHRSDFEKQILKSTWITTQESVVLFTECNKKYAQLVYLDDRPNEHLGSLRDVPEMEAKAQDAWIYRPDMGCYWIARKYSSDKYWIKIHALDYPNYEGDWDEEQVRQECISYLGYGCIIPTDRLVEKYNSNNPDFTIITRNVRG